MADASVIGRTSVVRGNVRGDGSLEILGRVEGDVSVSGDIVLGESAGVRGNLSGATITISGQVQGDIRGTESVLVETGARIVGDLLAPRIGVAAGALVRGHVRTEGEAPLQSAQRRPAVAAVRAPTSFGKPAPAPARVEPPRVVPPPAPPAVREEEAIEPEEQPKAAAKEPPKKAEGERQAPPPIVPALTKGAKAKKKKQKD